MSSWKITDQKTGLSFKITGENEPTASDIEEILKAAREPEPPERPKPSPEKPELPPEKPEPSPYDQYEKPEPSYKPEELEPTIARPETVARGLPSEKGGLKESFEREKEIEKVTEKPEKSIFTKALEGKPLEDINTEINAEIERAKNKGGDIDYLDKLKNAWNQGELNTLIDMASTNRDIDYEKDIKPIEERLSKLQDVAPAKADKWYKNALLGVAHMLPALIEGGLTGVTFGTAAAGTAAKAGAAIPAPEEAFTMPAAYTGGQMVGSSMWWRKQGEGTMYRELKHQGIKDEIARPASQKASILYALIEMSQFLKYVPVLGKVYKKAIAKELSRSLAKSGVRLASDVFENILQEGVQGGIAEGTKEASKIVEGRDVDLSKSAIKIFKRTLTDIKESATSIAALMLPGQIITTTQAANLSKKVDKNLKTLKKSSNDAIDALIKDKKISKQEGEQTKEKANKEIENAILTKFGIKEPSPKKEKKAKAKEKEALTEEDKEIIAEIKNLTSQEDTIEDVQANVDRAVERGDISQETANTIIEEEKAARGIEDTVEESEGLSEEDIRKNVLEKVAKGELSETEIEKEVQIALEGQKKLLKEKAEIAINEYTPERAEKTVEENKAKDTYEIPNEERDTDLDPKKGEGIGILNKQNTKQALKDFAQKTKDSKSEKGTYALYFDIDNFKAINEEYGHGEGDNVLKEMAKDINSFFPDKKRGREGGEEFAVWGLDASDAQRAADFIGYIENNLDIKGESITISAGFGKGTTLTEAGKPRVLAEKNNDIAKNLGKNQIVLDIQGEKVYIKGKDRKEKDYVAKYQRRAIPKAIEQIKRSKQWEVFTPEERENLERTILTLRKSGKTRPATEPRKTDIPRVKPKKKQPKPTREQLAKKYGIKRPKNIQELEKVTNTEDIPAYQQYKDAKAKYHKYKNLKFTAESVKDFWGEYKDLDPKQKQHVMPPGKKGGKNLDKFFHENKDSNWWNTHDEFLSELESSPTNQNELNLIGEEAIDQHVDQQIEGAKEEERQAPPEPPTETEEFAKGKTEKKTPKETIAIIPLSKSMGEGIAYQEKILNKEDVKKIKFEKKHYYIKDGKKVYFKKNERAVIIGNPKTKTATITLNPRTPKAEQTKTIVEEIAHFGVAKALKNEPNIGKYLKKLYDKDKTSAIKEEVEEYYKDKPEKKFNEWITKNYRDHIIQHTKESLPKKVYHAVRDLIRRMLKKAGIVDYNLNDLMNVLSKEIKKPTEVELSPKPTFSRYKLTQVEQQEYARAYEDEEKRLRGKLLSIPDHLVEKRLYIERQIRKAREKKLQNVKRAIISYASDNGAIGTRQQRIARMVERAKSTKVLGKIMKDIDKMVERQNYKIQRENLKRLLNKEKKRLKQPRKQKKETQISLEGNRIIKNYIDAIEMPIEEKQKAIKEILSKTEDKNFSFDKIENMGALAMPAIKNMNITELNEAINFIKKTKKRAFEINRDKIKQEVIKRKINKEIEGVLPKRKGKKRWGKKTIEKTKTTVEGGVAYHLSPEALIEIITKTDGKSNLKTYLYDTFIDAFRTKFRNLKKANQKFEEIYGGIKWDNLNKYQFEIKDRGFEYNMTQAMSVYANSKNDRNHEILLFTVLKDVIEAKANKKKEFNPKDIEEANKIIENMIKTVPQEYKDAIDKQIKHNDNVAYPRINAEYVKEHGIDMPKEHNYFRIMNISGVSGRDNIFADILGKSYTRNAISIEKGFAMARVGGKVKFKNLDYFQNVLKTMQDVEHYIGFNDYIRNARNILLDNDVKENLQKADDVVYSHLLDWVDFVSKGKIKPAKHPADKAAMFVVDNVGSSYIAINPSVILKQIPSWAAGAYYLEKKRGSIPKAAWEYMKMGHKGTRKFIFEKDPFMESRAERFIPILDEFMDSSEINRRLKKLGLYKFKDKMFAGIKFTDGIVTNHLWLARYYEVLDKTKDEVKAINAASKLIRTTQPVGDPLFKPKAYRSRGMARGLYRFTTQLNQYFNIMAKDLIANKNKSLREKATEMSWIGLAVPVLFAFIGAGLSFEKMFDEPEEILMAQAKQAGGALPFAGDLMAIGGRYAANSIRDAKFQKKKSVWFEQKMSYIPLDYVNDTFQAIYKGEWDKTFEQALRLRGVPVSVIKRTAKAYKDENWRLLFAYDADRDYSTEKRAYDVIMKNQKSDKYYDTRQKLKEKYTDIINASEKTGFPIEKSWKDIMPSADKRKLQNEIIKYKRRARQAIDPIEMEKWLKENVSKQNATKFKSKLYER